MNILLQDIRFGFRMLVKNLGFTTIAVVSLALGIGAITAVFSLVNGIFLSSLPVPNPQELLTIQWAGDALKFGGISGGWSKIDGRDVGESFSYPVFETLREQCARQADIFGFKDTGTMIIRTRHEAFGAEGLLVSDNFFSALQVQPLIGRLFMPGNQSEEDAQGIVITYPLWEKEFDLDPNALGQSVTVDGHSFTVIGILLQGFPSVRAGKEYLFYVSMAAQPQLKPNFAESNPALWWIPLMARIKPGVAEAQLQASLDAAFAHASAEWMTNSKTYIGDGRRGARDYWQDEYKKSLFLLFVVVGIVVLVVCVNLSGLLLARGTTRQHEFSIRAAVGAGRWRMIRQTLTENVLLCIIGSGLGVMFSLWGKDLLVQLMSRSRDGLHYDTSLDIQVLGFVFAVTVVTALASGLLPALRAAYANPLSGLKTHTVHWTSRLRRGKVLVVIQIALSLVLLTGAGLYVRTLVNTVRIDPGFAMDNLLWLEVNPVKSNYRGEAITDYFDRVQAALTTLPGVQSVAFSQYALLDGWCNGGIQFTFPGHPFSEYSARRMYQLTVGESFFETMGIPLRLGRAFTSADTPNAPQVVVVNETFVRQFLPDVYPIGQILRVKEDVIIQGGITNEIDVDREIVGVCADTKYNVIKESIPPTIYCPSRQELIGIGSVGPFLAIRTHLPPAAVISGIRRTMAAIDSNVPIFRVVTQTQLRDRLISSEWMFAILCASLAGLAVLLACIGLYGLMAYNMAQRTNEIGIRMALGATARNIAGPILRDAFLMAVAGVLLGGLIALAVTRLIRNQLYGVTATDPVTFIAAILAIFILALFACYIPARRAAKVDPMVALRCE